MISEKQEVGPQLDSNLDDVLEELQLDMDSTETEKENIEPTQ